MYTVFIRKFIALTAVGALALNAVPALASGSVDIDTNEKNYAPALSTWTYQGEADRLSDGRVRIEEDEDSNDTIGSAYANISVSSSQEGDYALLIAFTRAEKVHPKLANGEENITGLPDLYGYFMEDDSHILTYLQGGSMLHSYSSGKKWDVSYGTFKIPDDTENIRFFLMQASRKGTERDGRDAWFYKPGLYIVDSQSDANDIVAEYRDELDEVADLFDGQAADSNDNNDDEDEDTTPDYAVGTLLKCSDDSDVYSMEKDNTLKLFPNEDTFYAWGKSFADVKTISCSALDDYRVSGTWTYTRANYLVRFHDYPQVYTLDNALYLRHIPNEHTAVAMFGTHWQSLVREFPASDIGDYKYSAPHPLK